MNKLKKLWKENRVLLVLGLIVVACIIVIMIVMFQYFFGVTTSSYGDRLDSIQSVPFDNEAIQSLESSYQDEHLVSVKIETRGKIIYALVKYDAAVSLADAQAKSIEAYNKIEEQYRKLYDFNVTVIQDATEVGTGYHLMGAKNVSSESFVWSNNTPIQSGE